jgi:O-succinylhomoserine sulfhydrylase
LILIVDNCNSLFTATYKMGFSGAFCYKANGWSRTSLGGVTVGEPELIKKIYLFSRLTGPSLPLMLGFYQKFRDF